MKKRELVEMIRVLETRIQGLETRLTRMEFEAMKVTPVSPTYPIISYDDITRCRKCGLSGMSSYACDRNDCPTRVNITCSTHSPTEPYNVKKNNPDEP